MPLYTVYYSMSISNKKLLSLFLLLKQRVTPIGSCFIYLIPNSLSISRPTFLSLPLLVSGIPMFLDTLPLIPEIPNARFQENEIPNFLPIFTPTTINYSLLKIKSNPSIQEVALDLIYFKPHHHSFVI